MAKRTSVVELILKRIGASPAIKITSSSAASGPDIEVEGDITAATFTGTASALSGLTIPQEQAEADVTAAQLWTALAAAGIIVEPEA
jgi:5-enolpyruvylshikimate-3-phosphate synthase